MGSIALATAVSMLFDQAYLFETAYAEDESVAGRDWINPDPEVLYPLQASLLGVQIDALSSQTEGQIDIYAVLGAGSPTQQIFQREIGEMERTLNSRFEASGHVIMLGPTVQDQTARPLLNRTNFAASLKAIADKMNTSEDIALVFLTSHGSPGKLSTYFPSLTYNNLTSTEVATAFDESGLMNAIIVISACYSGSFVDELKRPTRLILTASATDRSSFGCSDENIFTD